MIAMINDLIKELEEKIQESKDCGESPDAYDWGMEEGVLVSRQNAEKILAYLKQRKESGGLQITKNGRLINY